MFLPKPSLHLPIPGKVHARLCLPFRVESEEEWADSLLLVYSYLNLQYPPEHLIAILDDSTGVSMR